MGDEVNAVILEVQLVEVLAVRDLLCDVHQIHICVGNYLGGRDLDGQLRHIAGREPRGVIDGGQGHSHIATPSRRASYSLPPSTSSPDM